ncbi:uncharacterized protein LOC117574393 [Drosophila albomicans]|uniref:Uncharacterized protein LOC117574393 n=1 Tax=Drosophila albomicans TaxID=7291 RepID=A0A6P8ZC11_DROAB|nr:uncharacterized protein LOC117574393 [Drosophila albomicans]
MENSRRSIATNEDSMSMYLSFDADDTLASKWQSVMTTSQSQSHYMEVQQSMLMDQTLEDHNKKSVLKSLIQNETTRDQISPLRPFDQSLLNKHNALCSTPTKNKTLTDVNNKENTQPDMENNTTLSSTIDGTASTVKINTMLTETNPTINEISLQEISSNKTNNVYPLSADVLLENITEVSNEETSMSVPSPVEEVLIEKQETTNAVATDMINEVSELINKALKLTGSSLKPLKQPEQPPQEKCQQKPLPTVNLPRPRRSFLPTASGQTFKQRMSIVVKTTLNSPARKLAAANASGRRSCLPTARTSMLRKSTIVRSTESSCSSSVISVQSSSSSKVPTLSAKPFARPSLAPKPKAAAATAPKFNCQLCSATFLAKQQLDVHMRKHLEHKKPGVCKYCDKKFQLERALHIHLMQNCQKIPPAEKRKLQYTELNHEKKAQLPKLLPPESPVFPCKPTITDSSLGRSNKLQQQQLMSNKEEQQKAVVPMAPPASKMPKKVPHSGVYCTPTKLVPCHSCKLSFKSVLDYTNHCLTVHSSMSLHSRKPEAATAPSAQQD